MASTNVSEFFPPVRRCMPENVLVVAFYYGKKKPNPFDLLFPLFKDMRQLFDEGIRLIYNGTHYEFRPMILYACFDLPARAMVQNIKYPTGANACPICLHPGVSIKEGN